MKLFLNYFSKGEEINKKLNTRENKIRYKKTMINNKRGSISTQMQNYIYSRGKSIGNNHRNPLPPYSRVSTFINLSDKSRLDVRTSLSWKKELYRQITSRLPNKI